MSNVWIISDTHFGHENIIKYENRPFKNAYEMNIALINKWNSKIKKDDKVFHLGDFALGNANAIASIVSQLNGHKILIRGNHDRSRSSMLAAGFDEVYDFPIIYQGFYMLSHQPLYVNENMPYVNIHGHIHSTKMEGKQYFNACVELHDFMPINFLDIKKLFAKGAK